MCLGELGRVVQVLSGRHVEVRVDERTVPVSLIILDSDVGVGDWLLVHAGFALARLGADEAQEALALRSAAHGEAQHARAQVPADDDDDDGVPVPAHHHPWTEGLS